MFGGPPAMSKSRPPTTMMRNAQCVMRNACALDISIVLNDMNVYFSTTLDMQSRVGCNDKFDSAVLPELANVWFLTQTLRVTKAFWSPRLSTLDWFVTLMCFSRLLVQ